MNLLPVNWLENKKIVVIGGTTGIGLAAARAFVTHGARLVVVGNTAEGCTQAAALLGEAARVQCADATQPGTAEAAIATCTREWGDFDGLYHVAGGSGRRFGDGPLHEISLEGWNQTFALNLTSLFLSNQAAVRQWLARGRGGSMLNISSVLGYAPSPTYFSTHAYAAAKAAVIGFTRATAAYYAPHNIRVNALAPALVETPMSQRASGDEAIMSFIRTKQPLEGGRNGQPDDLAGAALYFLSDYARFTTGQVLAVDGGWSVSDGQMSPSGP